jgi:hypothetical protein
MSVSAFASDNKTTFNLMSNKCDTEKCEIIIKDNKGIKAGSLFISKKNNEQNGASQYNVILKNLKNKNSAKYLVSCLSDYTCKAFTYKNEDLADFALASNKFKQNELEESTKSKININLSSDTVSIYTGNNSVIIGFPE